MTSYDETSMTNKFQIEVAISYKHVGGLSLYLRYLTSLYVSKHVFYTN